MEILKEVELYSALYHYRLTSYIVSQSSDSTSISTASSISRNDTISRSSTPATEISSRPSSPTFVVPVETPERRRRREQSDQASSEIGRRLLRGWALLGDECLNEGCFGVPLMRPPKTGGEKDPRKVSQLEPLSLFPSVVMLSTSGVCDL